MTIQRIKLKDLNTKFIEKLKTHHKDEDLEITFWLQSAPSQAKEKQLSEQQFWQLISLLDWEKTGDSDAVIEPLVTYLSNSSIEIIKVFEDILSEKLFMLDGEKFAKEIGKKSYQQNNPFSVDNFLYARCCVVANGKSFFQKVLNNPSKMPKNLTFSVLLRVASKAYHSKTALTFIHSQ